MADATWVDTDARNLPSSATAKFSMLNLDPANLPKYEAAPPPPPAGEGGGKSTARRDFLLACDATAQKRWADEKLFEADPDPDTARPKFFVTFPYPYMNGRLHLGHAFSLTKAEFAANYHRCLGDNVLWPFAFHCTGMPIQAAANRLRDEMAEFGTPPVFPAESSAPAAKKEAADVTSTDPSKKMKGKKGKLANKTEKGKVYQWQTMEKMNIPAADVPEFADSLKWLEYFPPLGKEDLEGFGLCVDWRRSFITTPVNPFYDAFIRWQFNTLKKKGKIDFGKRPNIYSVKDAGVCGDHDRASGEGAAPQEYVLVKLKVLWDEELPVRAGASASPLQALKDAGEEVYLAPATLRPETMYAQTNCFVLPEGRYGAYRLADGSVFVVSARSASGLAHQDRCKVYGEMDCLCEFDGWDLLGLPLRPVNGIKYDRMYTLPLLTIKMDKGTGVVTSVPSDAPDDFVALQQLKDKPEFRAKYGLKDEWVLPFDVVPVVEIPAYVSDAHGPIPATDTCAAFWCEKLGIKSQNDAEKLAEAKAESYLRGFTSGVMKCGKYKGQKVETAKPIIKNDMIAAGDAILYWEPDKKVMARSGGECIVALCDQWYLNYGDDAWTAKLMAHIQSENFNAYADDSLAQFKHYVVWLQAWACSRLFGLGTNLPWDEKWVIESLSDSTVYFAYYTIAHFLHGADNVKGEKGSPCGLTPEQCTDEVFDYIFLKGSPAPSTNGVDAGLLGQMKASFEYWYPMDLRCSGKDLIGNHLSFMMFNHVAIWDEQPEMWPRGVFTNGHVMVDGAKMSKSTGNFLMLKDTVATYGADAMRLACAVAGDTNEDCNFDTKVANANVLALFNEAASAKDILEREKAGTLRTGGPAEYLWMDKVFLNEMDRCIGAAGQCYTDMRWRDGVMQSFYELLKVRDFYLDLCKRAGLEPHAAASRRFVVVQAGLLAPITPHFADHVWRDLLGNASSVLKGGWPSVSGAPDKLMSQEATFLRKAASDLRVACAKEKKKTKAYVYVADTYNDWKVAALEFLQGLVAANGGKLLAKKDAVAAVKKDFFVSKPEFKKQTKNVMQFAAYMLDEAAELGPDALAPTVAIDQKGVLQQNMAYLVSFVSEQKGEPVALTLFNLSEPDVPGDKKKQLNATPGKVAVAFY